MIAVQRSASVLQITGSALTINDQKKGQSHHSWTVSSYKLPGGYIHAGENHMDCMLDDDKESDNQLYSQSITRSSIT